MRIFQERGDVSAIPLTNVLSLVYVRGVILMFVRAGQIVCLAGTALVGSTPELCRYADVALCIGPAEPRTNASEEQSAKKRKTKPLPQHGGNAAASHKRPNPYLQFACAVASLPSSVTLPHDIPLKVFVKVLQDARRSLQGMQQCLLLAGIAQVWISVV